MANEWRSRAQGYIDDGRNTDNAWIESKCYHVHDDTGVLSRFELSHCQSPGVMEVSWAVVHKHLNLHAEHTSLLELIARAKDAAW